MKGWFLNRKLVLLTYGQRLSIGLWLLYTFTYCRLPCSVSLGLGLCSYRYCTCIIYMYIHLHIKDCQCHLYCIVMYPVSSTHTLAHTHTHTYTHTQYTSWLIWKDPDAGKDWGQEEKGTTEDEVVGWHHQLDGHEFGWTMGVGDGQGGLACCSSWGHKESDTTERLNWTEPNWLFVACEVRHAAEVAQ